MLKQLGGNGTEPAAAAKAASLVHVSDEEPGIRRRRAGKGFSYRDAKGKTVSDPKTLDRVRYLAIPPAWTDVWISPADNGHIQATGRDAKGRKQYRYHERWSLCRDEAKYSSLAAFADALPELRAQVDTDLRRHNLPREKVVSSIVWLLDNTMIRVGNAAYARDNKSFGLTTLKSRHVAVEGSRLRFGFKGKSGKEWRIQLIDRRMAKIIRRVQELPGQQLFQYVDADGERRRLGSQDINDYIRAACGQDFTSKHFRTWGGTIHAASLFAETPVPEAAATRKRVMNTVIDMVAARLGNTRAVCRACYIHPRVLESWEEGRLTEELAEARRARRKIPEGLDEEEAVVRTWLAAG
ncbi:DNA topoisomerase IB [Mesorhizobium sp. LHD-90]|uniref:DNA topoisomerase IB n=1 Tax=Mesorhizobium sp. LHD-90 TaxID=3071414 RepID=UPI0027E0529E|nr:DNA topoisomerase IB [Mesorhizobium sp. LHD-90]MDQ6436697.1 DNA topoisomerase IB [Mesorhizobium sp. LHD-90]